MENLAGNLSFSSLLLPLRFSTFAMTDYSSGNFYGSAQNGSFQNGAASLKRSKKFFKKSPYLPLGIVLFIVVIIGFFMVKNAFHNQPVQTTSTTLGTSTSTTVTPIAVAKPLVTETINKTFQFPLTDSAGKVVSKIQYEIQSAELDDQIVVQGQVATAVQGRVFLVLNLKITNNYDKSVQLNTRDYIRLLVDNSTSKLAADINNDPVDVEAISTKYTRLGFPIDSNFKNLKLEVGEITGPKQTIQLNLK